MCKHTTGSEYWLMNSFKTGFATTSVCCCEQYVINAVKSSMISLFLLIMSICFVLFTFWKMKRHLMSAFHTVITYFAHDDISEKNQGDKHVEVSCFRQWGKNKTHWGVVVRVNLPYETELPENAANIMKVRHTLDAVDQTSQIVPF